MPCFACGPPGCTPRRRLSNRFAPVIVSVRVCRTDETCDRTLAALWGLQCSLQYNRKRRSHMGKYSRICTRSPLEVQCSLLRIHNRNSRMGRRIRICSRSQPALQCTPLCNRSRNNHMGRYNRICSRSRRHGGRFRLDPIFSKLRAFSQRWIPSLLSDRSPTHLH